MIYQIFKGIGDMISRFRKKKTVIETLEGLDKEIKQLELNKQSNQSNQRKYISALVLYSICIYIFGAILYFMYFMPKSFSDKAKSSIPFLITPFIVYFARRFLKWFYVRRVVYFEDKLKLLKEEKKKIIEEVKEKETYKKAREILEKFSNETELISNLAPLLAKQQPQQPIQMIQRQMLKQNPVPQSSRSNSIPEDSNNIRQSNRNNLILQSNFTNNEKLTKTLVPRPLVPQTRTGLDKIIDFFIGDGPNNRYALICLNCYSHNGMALKEEFEFVAFRCAYCLQFNPSRKTKLSVPKLESLNETSTIHSIEDNEQQTPSEEQNTDANSVLKESQIIEQKNDEIEDVHLHEHEINGKKNDKKME